MKLYIGNKTYSSWSMRPWVLMRACGVDFEEVWVPFDGFEAHHSFKQTMAALHPAATVPALAAEGQVFGDSLAIVDYLNDAYPEAGIWPEARIARAKARLLAALMHSGFSALRGHCPMNIGADLSQIGAELYETHADLREDMARLEAILAPHMPEGDLPEGDLRGEGYLCGDFCAADAFYAPVMSRIESYGLPVSAPLAAYQSRLLAHPAVREWYEGALAETIFLDFEEPYRSAVD